MERRLPRVPVFDVGNVLIRWDPRYLYRKLFEDEKAMEHFLAHVCTAAWNEEQDRGRSFADGVAHLVRTHPELEPMISAYDHRWHEMVPGAIEGTVAILEELRAAGLPTYAITNFSREKFEAARERFAFLGRFDGIVVSAEVGLLKPDLAIYRHLVSEHALSPEDCVFIDDSLPNVEAAREIGMTGIHFTDPGALRSDLVRLGFPLAAPTSSREQDGRAAAAP
jgi:2-haloacid dehalogenase